VERSTAEPPERPAGKDEYAGVDERRLVLTALAALPARQRAVIVLRFYEDLTEVQAAEMLGCAVSTVKSQTAKALNNLRSGGLLLASALPEDIRD
jgi:RNA polymerase sigma factor (sigma-70 family)